MTLSELFGDEPLITPVAGNIREQASYLWSLQFEQIIQENRGPKIKTRIHVKKGKKNG
jgi:hypothetical protein